MSYLTYLGERLSNGWAFGWAFAKTHTALEIVGVVVSGAIAATFDYQQSGSITSATISGALVGLAAAIVILVMAMLFGLLSAPYRMWRMKNGTIANLQQQLAASQQHYDPEVARQLQQLYEQGRSYIPDDESGFSDFVVSPQVATLWGERVEKALDRWLPAEVFGFKSIGDNQTRFRVKVEKLRKIIMRYEEHRRAQ